MDDHSDEGVRLTVAVELVNPNDVPLPLVGAEYRLSLEKAVETHFQDLPNRTLPAGGSQVVFLSGSVVISKSRLADWSYRVSGNIIYEPPGEIRARVLRRGMV